MTLADKAGILHSYIQFLWEGSRDNSWVQYTQHYYHSLANILQGFVPPPLGKKSAVRQEMGGKSSKLAVFNRILTLISYFFSNFQQNHYIFCQFLLTMSSSIQFCINFVKISLKFGWQKMRLPLAQVTLFCKIFTSVTIALRGNFKVHDF